ncbi:MAG: nitronate monooxygenase [Armatimonadota bacterium]
MTQFAQNELGCRVPLILAPIAHLASHELIASVTNAGGLGTFPLHRHKPEHTDYHLKQIRNLTDGSIMVSFTGEWERDENLDVLLHHNISVAMVFWWNGPRLIHRLQSHGIKVGWQVGTDEQLSEATGRNADFIIAQGLEAGGPVRSPHRLSDLVQLIRGRTSTPIVVTGGINTPEKAANFVPQLAAGVMLGTRFCASHEANNSAEDKALLSEADRDTVILDTSLRGDWPCAYRRRLISGGDQDIPERYANSNIDEIKTIVSAKQIVDNFAKVLAI